jgi:hypothetical protein
MDASQMGADMFAEGGGIFFQRHIVISKIAYSSQNRTTTKLL